MSSEGSPDLCVNSEMEVSADTANMKTVVASTVTTPRLSGRGSNIHHSLHSVCVQGCRLSEV